MSNVTMGHIADYTGVSRTTVSFVLNGRERAGGTIGEETRQKVLEAARILGYKPNRAALSLRTGTTNRIELITQFLKHSAHHNRIIPIVAEVLRDSKYQLDVTGVHVVYGQETMLPEVAPGTVDGIIAFELEHLMRTVSAADWANMPPMVSVGTAEFIERAGDYVGCDLRSGATAAIRHLQRVGAKRIAFLTSADLCDQSEPRYGGYVNAMAEAGLPVELILVPSGVPAIMNEGGDALDYYLQSHSAPEALFCVNDEVALAAFRVLRNRGLRIPDDVLLVGSNGNVELTLIDPQISTIVQPVEEMCRLAWEFLQRRIADPLLAPQQVVLPAPFVARESSGAVLS